MKRFVFIRCFDVKHAISTIFFGHTFYDLVQINQKSTAMTCNITTKQIFENKIETRKKDG